MLDDGVNVGLGVDGSASNDAGSLLHEARLACFLQRAGGDVAGAVYSALTTSSTRHCFDLSQNLQQSGVMRSDRRRAAVDASTSGPFKTLPLSWASHDRC